MKLADFDYHLPRNRIAQEPAPERARSRLMVVHRKNGVIDHFHFADLPRFLERGDVLAVNETKVLPARLTGCKESGGRVELLLVRQAGKNAGRPGGGEKKESEWECLAQGGRLRPGTRLLFAEGIQGELTGKNLAGLWALRLKGGEEVLAMIGDAPLPPYIRRNGGPGTRTRDLSRYQTVYARNEGAIAAPTAGLHFTGALLQEIRDRGVRVCPLTLHVGIGTFLPVKTAEVEEHRLEPENYEVPAGTAAAINRARDQGKRVFAVGTTVTRTLETCTDEEGRVQPGSGQTDLFIFPGFRFRAVDRLITNFHLPRSTLLMLVSAFAGRELMRAAYAEAIRGDYRFYSYGDAMLIL